MNHLKLTALSMLLVFLAGCFGGGGGPETTSPITYRSDEEYDRRRREDPDRRDVIDRVSRQYSGATCEEEERTHDCRDQCRDIYTNSGARKRL